MIFDSYCPWSGNRLLHSPVMALALAQLPYNQTTSSLLEVRRRTSPLLRRRQGCQCLTHHSWSLLPLTNSLETIVLRENSILVRPTGSGTNIAACPRRPYKRPSQPLNTCLLHPTSRGDSFSQLASRNLILMPPLSSFKRAADP